MLPGQEFLLFWSLETEHLTQVWEDSSELPTPATLVWTIHSTDAALTTGVHIWALTSYSSVSPLAKRRL